MHNRKFNSKKKGNTNNLINFDAFLKYRSDKEKIISNPFQENWKKAIVIQELLELYKPQQDNFVPNNTTYDKKDFQNFYKHKTKFDEQDSIWENNEDYQLNKFHKMAEGVNNYDELFMNHKIIKTAQKIEGRIINHSHTSQQFGSPTLQKTKKQKINGVKYNKVYFRKENLKEFEQFIDFKQIPRKSFLAWKGKIERLQKKAIDQYGVVFPREEATNEQGIDYARYKEREDAIFQKFIREQPSKPSIPTLKSESPKELAFDEISNIPSTIFKHAIRPNTSCPSSPVKIFKSEGRHRNVARKKYFRVPGA